jgi:hypothetical protein
VLRKAVVVSAFVAVGLVVQMGQAQAQTVRPTAPPAARTDQSPEEPATNLSFGYAYMYDGSWKEHLLYGFVGSITHRIRPTLSIVGEVGGSHGEYRTTGFTIQRYAALGGVRLSAGEGDVKPFFQALAGYSRQGGDVGIANGIAVQPGGGVDLVMSESLTLRAQGDYRFLREDGHNYSQYRISGGVIIYLGKNFKPSTKK